MKIASFMPSGNGANVLHQQLAKFISGYRLLSYSPRMEYVPFVLPFFSLYGRKDAELIHASLDNGLFFHNSKAPLVVTAHNYMLDAEMRPYSSLVQRVHYATDLKCFVRRTVSLSDSIVCVSHFIADMVRQHHSSGDKTVVIPNGVDHRQFIDMKRRGEHNKKFRVLFSGNLTRRKGAQWLSPIASRLDRGVELHYTAGLRNYSEYATIANMFPVGYVLHSDMPALYNQYDALVLPTVREGLPLVALEAMACGLPVVATHCSSLPELIEEGKGGYLCDLGCPQQFAEAINVLASSPNLRMEMGAYNRNRIEENYTLDLMCSRYLELFEKTLLAFRRNGATNG